MLIPPTSQATLFRPFWSPNRALMLLQMDKYSGIPSPIDALHKSLFLLALATSFCTSLFRALTRHDHWTMFTTGFTHVSLAPATTRLSKNGWEDHWMRHVLIPSWIETCVPHRLCPVWDIQTYFTLIPQAQMDPPINIYTRVGHSSRMVHY